jgi:hypothetical protein
MRHAPLILAVSALALSGCYVASFFVPVGKSAADSAHELDKKCRGFSDPGSLPLLLPYSAIDSVEPAYAHVVDPPADHLTGALIHVRPLGGLSKETLTRTLECHEASVILGSSPLVAYDPYTLPGRWIDIDVDSAGDSFVVRVRVDNFKDAKEVLARSKSYFAATREPTAPPSVAPGSGSVSLPTPPAPPLPATSSPLPVVSAALPQASSVASATSVQSVVPADK